MNFSSTGRLYTPTALLIAAALIGSGVWHSIITPFALEHRWARDLVGLTPFHDVRIDKVAAQGQRLTVWGSFIKRRCEKTGHIAYAKAHGALILAEFSADGEPVGTPPNRPPSEYRQLFGPWTFISKAEAPESAMFFTYHKCPEGDQTNVVFEVPWENTP